MNKHRKDSDITRQLILHAGCQVFCEKGYYHATIAEICSRAGTNIASVNYHFGDKATLYQQAWLNAFDESRAEFPVGGGVPEDAPPDERLRGYITSIVRKMTSKTNDLKLFHKELANPTGLLSDIMPKKIEPEFREGMKIIQLLLGDGATDEQVKFCHASIMGQCFNAGPPPHENRDNRMKPPDFITDADSYCKHIVKFSLAGIRALSEEIAAAEHNRETKEA